VGIAFGCVVQRVTDLTFIFKLYINVKFSKALRCNLFLRVYETSIISSVVLVGF